MNMPKKREPLILIVSAPSGSGKTTLVSKVLEKMEGIKSAISYTTRAPREGEKDNEDYKFISIEEFKKKIDGGEFLEWEENFGNYYGTSQEELRRATEKGEDVILSIDVKGAKTVKKMFPESICVFIMPPSIEELEARLRNRKTDQEKQVALRLNESAREIAAAEGYDYIVVNEDLAMSTEELKTIIEDERKNRDNYQTEKG